MNLVMRQIPTSTGVAKAVASRDGTVSLRWTLAYRWHCNEQCPWHPIQRNCRAAKVNGGSDCDEKHGHELEAMRSDVSTGFEATCLVKEFHLDRIRKTPNAHKISASVSYQLDRIPFHIIYPLKLAVLLDQCPDYYEEKSPKPLTTYRKKG
ncbi:hypothetical protein B0H14DRAFT_2612145 [Mycena olivaceomarginata]|nr:hypothetical protein B0H14DRAFT_2612145 [Mycena olivaceomarginata]